MGSHSLLQVILLAQESNPGLLHCRQTLCCLSHQEGKVAALCRECEGSLSVWCHLKRPQENEGESSVDTCGEKEEAQG